MKYKKCILTETLRAAEKSAVRGVFCIHFPGYPGSDKFGLRVLRFETIMAVGRKRREDTKDNCAENTIRDDIRFCRRME